MGQRIVVIDRIDDDQFRWTHFMLRQFAEYEQPFKSGYVPVVCLRGVQGVPGKRPRWDSGEKPNDTQMPSATLVVDAIHVDHNWTEAHAGVMIVECLGWTAIYVHSQRVHIISPFEKPYRGNEAGVAETIVKALDPDIPVQRARGIYRAGMEILPSDLSRMRLEYD